jgi:hypothetical protein
MRKVLSKALDELPCFDYIHINNTVIFGLDVKIWKILPCPSSTGST